jgi:hypothetical protein
MYKAMWDNINRHIGVIWHSVTVLVGAGAVFALVQGDVIPIDFASALVILVAAWQVAHVYDASYWVNRNLLIIRNIERQFLRAKDIKEVHCYFAEQRGNKMIEHFQIQFALGVVVGALTIAFHIWKRGWPWQTVSATDWAKVLPYAVLMAGIGFVLYVRGNHASSYTKLAGNSPGGVIAE